MTWVALALAGVALVIGLSIAPRLRDLPSIRPQLVSLVLLAIFLTLTPLLLFAAVTFRSALFTRQGIAVLAVGAASTGAALVAALSLQRAIMRAVDDLSMSVVELAAGDLSARAPVEGPNEIRELAVSFNRMAENVETLVESRQEMTAWISHDLAAPLTLLKAMLEAIADGVAQPGDYLRPMQEQVDVMAGLIADLLELARIDAGQLTVELRETSLGDTIEMAVGAATAMALQGRVSLSTAIEEQLPAAWCDEMLVDRVLLNLLTNAIRHTPPEGRVEVRAWSSDDEVLVAVTNSGPWLSENAIAKVFDPFWRGEGHLGSGSRDERGLGLGLTIARGMVAAQGGRIDAENRAEGGVRFTFSLQVRRSK